MLASDITDRASDLLKDADHVRWPLASLYRWIGDSQRTIVEMRPSANPSHVDITLVEGAVQTVPATAFRLLDIVRNVGTGGKPGRAITYADLEMMNLADPNWMLATKERTIRQWLYDERNPRVFYTYPPASVSGTAPKVVGLVSTLPAAPTAAGDTLILNDEYLEAVLAYTMFLCYSQESESANPVQARAWLTAFSGVMQGKPLFELKAGPKGMAQGAAQDAADRMGGN
jgi:hypothetical protein